MTDIRSIAAALALLCLWDCSSQPSTGGGGFEGETVALSGVVRLAGRRVAGASVRMLDLRTNASLGRTSTNPDGEFRLVLAAGSKGFLEIRGGDSALVRSLVESIGDDTLELDAVRPTAWTARLVMAGSPVADATVRIVGSTESVKTESDGSFALIRSGNAVEWVDVELSDGSRRQAPLPAATASVLEIPDHPSILLDDFEGPGTRTALGHATGSGWWFSVTDSVSDGESYFDPIDLFSETRAAYSTHDAHVGTSLRATFLTNTSLPVHYGMLGVVLSDSGLWMDLTRLDSITFMMKGLGATRVEIATRTGMVPTNDPLGKFGVDFDIPAEWTRMVVRKSDFLAPVGSRPDLEGIPWSVDSRRCNAMLFFFKGSATLQVDDIVWHGPGLSELVPGP